MDAAIEILDEHALRGPNRFATRPLWQLTIPAPDAVGEVPVEKHMDVDTTDIGHLVGSTAVALQQAAGIPVQGHHVEHAGDGKWNIAFDYAEEAAALEAGRFAVRLAQEADADRLARAIAAVREAYETTAPSRSVQALVRAARQRGVPVLRRTPTHHQLGWGILQQQLWHALPGTLSSLGFDIAKDRARTVEILRTSGIPLADGSDCWDAQDGRDLVQRTGLPVVVHPEGGAPQVVATGEELDNLLATLEAADQWAFVQEQVPGESYQVLVVADKVIGGVRTSDGTDCTDTMHPSVVTACRRAARLVGLDVVAVDLVASDLSRPAKDAGRVIALTPDPDLEPFLGRGAAEAILDHLLPESDGRIPLVGVTGTNGKTTTVRLIAHLLKYAGARVGMAVTGAIEVENEVVLRGDWSGPSGAQTVLREPGITHAICEVARGGILRSGLGFDACDVGVLLNVTADHLGIGGIDSLEDMTRLKSVVLRATRPDGHVVLNADDERVWALRHDLDCTVIPFTMDPEHAEVKAHLDANPDHVAVTVRDGAIEVQGRGVTSQGPAIVDMPVTLEGAARFNVQNALAATAAACALGMEEQSIWSGLTTFNPSVTQSPGRTNLLHIGGVKVLIDYGHNPAALEALAPVVEHLAAGRTINVACAAGNRREEDLQAFGATIAHMYDRIILTDADPRGRRPGETPRIVADGALEAGFDKDRLDIEPDEPTAQRRALEEARPGDLVVLQVDDIDATVRFCQDLQARIEADPDDTGRLQRALLAQRSQG